MVTLMGHGHLHPAVFDASRVDGAEIAPELLDHLDRSAARESSRAWRRINRNTKRLWRRAVKPATRKAASGALRGVEARLFERAAEAIRKAMSATSYLSDDRIYESKRGQLLDKVEMTMRLAA